MFSSYFLALFLIFVIFFFLVTELLIAVYDAAGRKGESSKKKMLRVQLFKRMQRLQCDFFQEVVRKSYREHGYTEKGEKKIINTPDAEKAGRQCWQDFITQKFPDPEERKKIIRITKRRNINSKRR